MVESVYTMPGAIPLTRMPLGPSSRANATVRPRTASFVTPYGVGLEYPVVEEMLTTAPPPRWVIVGRHACVIRTTPTTFTSNRVPICASVNEENGPVHF